MDNSVPDSWVDKQYVTFTGVGSPHRASEWNHKTGILKVNDPKKCEDLLAKR